MNKVTGSITKLTAYLMISVLFYACKSKDSGEVKTPINMTKTYPEGTFGYDVQFFKKLNIDIIELNDTGSNSRVLIVPGYQGRVMTSSSDGYEGQGFGWIKYDLIESGKLNPQFNPYGGEERLWLGPEGGKFSVYFKKGDKQDFSNWKVPDEIDSKPFDIVSRDVSTVKLKKDFNLVNYSGTPMKIGIERTVKILSRAEVEEILGFNAQSDLRFVAFQSENVLINKGEQGWNKESGLLSIWMLSMFRPSENGVVIIPFKQGNDKELGKKVNDDYFGKIPEDRLIVKDNVLFFKVDGKFRSKIGISPSRALPYCGSYDHEKKLLTVLWYSKPEKATDYVNSKWGDQDNPLKGDVVNSYNDGPVKDGSIMGPFYEIESSSPAASLEAGDSISHIQRIFHFSGNIDQLNQISLKLFGLPVSEIKME
jgi:hypothetical protein